ncbi:ATP-binding cassette domain-containing protein [Amycolatopsis sp. RM579]|uniref:ATP-binding cassette domain-containing protein n=1 Tax=Amycolatopsis pithecellobii TaxID=664692 RepID=A0A6N7Z666_9PSEU|nr:ATP-binding cassette domain-containing protein [Amycolatopsis pithecellobii]
MALTVNEVEKRYGAIHALKGVSLTVEPGEIRGLCGENGAGKSTLGKIIAGVVAPDAGEIMVDGKPIRLRSTAEALAHGISIVAQELAVVPYLTVAENVMLGQEPRRGIAVNRKQLRKRFLELSEQVGFSLDPNARLGALRKSEQQKAEILRAVARDARLIVMDEPTAALSSDEARQLVAATRRLAAEGRTIVFVSHHLDEVLAVCDNITVLRDGRYVRTGSAGNETPDSLVTSMTGQSLASEYPAKITPDRRGTPALRVLDLGSASGLESISLEIWPGEILGVAGLVGSGRSELARAIFGADPHDGTIQINGETIRINSVRRAINAGIAMLPENRKELGLMLERSVTENVSLPRLRRLAALTRVRRREERDSANEMLAKVGVRASAANAAVGTLSGGNQQKVMFAKWLMTSPKIFIADEPSQGVDVGARARIYELISEMARQGMAVLIISSELEEVIGLANRVLVMRRGQIVGEVADADGSLSADVILGHAFGTAVAS